MKRAANKTNRPQVGPTGLCLWDLPGSDLQVMWAGPGAGLMLIKNVPHGLMTNILEDGYAQPYDTRKDAQAAYDRFVAKAAAQS